MQNQKRQVIFVILISLVNSLVNYEKPRSELVRGFFLLSIF